MEKIYFNYYNQKFIINIIKVYIAMYNTYSYMFRLVHAVTQVIQALRYKPEGRGFDSRWSNWNFSLT
jgi:hypothetical protein